jgi:nucleoside-diphosphate-sugar epimerase
MGRPTALIVGGTGPTGVPIVEGLIARGFDITIYHRGAHEVEFSRPVTHIHGDPFSDQQIRIDLEKGTFDVVISTYGRMRHVARVMAKRTARFVGITSGAGYRAYRNAAHFPAGLPTPIPETHPTYAHKEDDPFGWAVAEGERQLLSQAAAGDFETTILRYPNVYGPRGAGPVVRATVRRILDGRRVMLVPGDGDRLRSRGYAENLAHAALLALESKRSSGQVYNVADERTLSLRGFIAIVAEFMDRPLELVRVAHPRMEELCRGYAGEGHHQFFDLAKIKGDLGYRDVVPVDNAVRETASWWIANMDAPGVTVAGPNGGGGRSDPLAYELEDRLLALTRNFHEQIEAEIPALGRDREKAREERADAS